MHILFKFPQKYIKIGQIHSGIKLEINNKGNRNISKTIGIKTKPL